MKTVNIYSFNELSELAKQKAINNIRYTIDNSYIYYEAEQTVKAFEKYFPTNSKGNNSWLKCNVIADDNVLELIGIRLRTYLINNFGYILFKGKYFGKLITLENGERKHVKRYSRVIFENCCNLTGVCYDDDMLSPIYDFLKGKNYQNYNFQELMEECYYNLEKTLENECDYMNTDEYLAEFLESNNYEFEENGELF